MHEEKTKDRGWVKNAAIIFLSVMLVLTFFSQTIMNRSLPEVATKAAQPGTITTRIRGNGAIEAAETFEVKTTDTRKVKSVLVKVGQQVEVGDKLVVLEAGSSDELIAAQDALDEAVYTYQVALLSASQEGENGDSPEVQLAREKLEAAILKRDGNKIDAATVASAKAKYDSLYTEYVAAANAVTAAGGDLTGGGSGPDSSAINAAQAALNEARIALSALKIQYKNEEAFMIALAQAAYQKDKGKATATESEYAPYIRAITNAFIANEGTTTGTGTTATTTLTTLKDYFTDTNTLQERTALFINEVDLAQLPFAEKHTALPDKTVNGVAKAYNKVLAATKAVSDAQTALTNAQSGGTYVPDNSYLMSKRDKAKAAADAAEKEYNDMKTQSETYETARSEVITCQSALQSAIVAQKKQVYDLQRYQKAVYRAQQKVASVGTGGAGGEITSTVSGVVKAVNVTAGNTADPNTPVLTVEVPDRGYTVSISVTREQAKRVTVGDAAEISTGYWGGSGMTAKLVNIKPDPQNASANRLLVFELSGEDIESGSQVSVSIGQKSQNYDIIVPSSAVRSDSNGSFVYMVAAKQSPLGSRYIATRVDVQVLAKDDTNTAISGGIAQYDYVITTSTKPIEKGMQVRLADG